MGTWRLTWDLISFVLVIFATIAWFLHSRGRRFVGVDCICLIVSLVCLELLRKEIEDVSNYKRSSGIFL